MERTGWSGRDHGLGPAVGGVHPPMLVDHRLEGADHGGADGDDPPAPAPGVVDPVGGLRGDPEVLGVGRLVGLERGHAGVQE